MIREKVRFVAWKPVHYQSKLAWNTNTDHHSKSYAIIINNCPKRPFLAHCPSTVGIQFQLTLETYLHRAK